MKIGMLFPDYASQYVGMGKELYDNSRIMQEYFEEASSCLDMNFIKLCFASSDSELAKITNAYVALFLTSSSIAALLQEEGIKPSLVAGYGIGEFAALHAVRGISLPDGLYVLNKFAHFYQDLIPTLDMTVIEIHNLPTREVKQMCQQLTVGKDKVYIAAYNTPNNTVVAGNYKAIAKAYQYALDHNSDVHEKPICSGLHGSLMEHVVEQVKVYLQKVDFKDLEIPIVTGIDGKITQQGEKIKDNLIEQLQAPIMWNKVLSNFEDCSMIIEVGPGATLTPLVKELYPDKPIFSINKRADIDAVHAFIASNVAAPVNQEEIKKD